MTTTAALHRRAEDRAPVRSRWPVHEEDEIEAVVSVLREGRVNALVHGQECAAFESEFAAYCGMPFGIAVGNGTLALELALRCLGVGEGDEVIVPARSFFATAACAVAVGAEPVFADIDPATHNIAPDSVRRMISPRTRAVIAVHLAGMPCAMDDLAAICAENGIFLIEDCAQAHGAEIGGRRAGSFGDAAAFSFCTDKIMSTGGEGGMLLLRDEAAWERAWAYKDHGKSVHKVRAPATGNGFRYLHDSFGSNFRLTEMQAAIGRRQLAKLDGWLARRRANAARLSERLGNHPAIEPPAIPDAVSPAFYKYYAMLRTDRLPADFDRDALLAALHTAGVPAGSGSCPDMSRECAFAEVPPRRDGTLETAHAVGARTLMLPVDHTLCEADMDRMADAVLSLLPAAER